MYFFKGAGVIVWRLDPKTDTLFVLLGKRRLSPGRGTWTVFGGHVDNHESFYAAARRELTEELRINLKFRKKRKGKLRLKLSRKRLVNFDLPFFKYEVYAARATEHIPIKEVKKHYEFSKFAWFDVEHLPTNLHFGMPYIIRRLKNRLGE